MKYFIRVEGDSLPQVEIKDLEVLITTSNDWIKREMDQCFWASSAVMRTLLESIMVKELS